ncbi:uncharacterized protein LOC136027269 [Artemia franciscana]|uniref:uncharacterized protein LOC136027269 n=1 Tax=Artemia franciscana TaxID=6661 RepID=UPI0032DABD3F
MKYQCLKQLSEKMKTLQCLKVVIVICLISTGSKAQDINVLDQLSGAPVRVSREYYEPISAAGLPYNNPTEGLNGGLNPFLPTGRVGSRSYGDLNAYNPSVGLSSAYAHPNVYASRPYRARSAGAYDPILTPTYSANVYPPTRPISNARSVGGFSPYGSDFGYGYPGRSVGF